MNNEVCLLWSRDRNFEGSSNSGYKLNSFLEACSYRENS